MLAAEGECRRRPDYLRRRGRRRLPVSTTVGGPPAGMRRCAARLNSSAQVAKTPSRTRLTSWPHTAVSQLLPKQYSAAPSVSFTVTGSVGFRLQTSDSRLSRLPWRRRRRRRRRRPKRAAPMLVLAASPPAGSWFRGRAGRNGASCATASSPPSPPPHFAGFRRGGAGAPS